MNVSGNLYPASQAPNFDHGPDQAPGHGGAAALTPMPDKGPARREPDGQGPGHGRGWGQRRPDEPIATKPLPYPLPDCGPRPFPRPPIDCLPVPMPKPFPRPPWGCEPLPVPKPLPQPRPPIGCEPPWLPKLLPQPPIGCWPPPEPPRIELPPIERPPKNLPPIDVPRPGEPGCGCGDPKPKLLDDTTETQYTPFIGPPQTVLDTGRWGPDQVDITLNRDGSSCVHVNGQTYSYSAEETRNLHVRVDDNDKVKVTDNRTPIQKVLEPSPIDVFNYP